MVSVKVLMIKAPKSMLWYTGFVTLYALPSDPEIFRPQRKHRVHRRDLLDYFETTLSGYV